MQGTPPHPDARRADSRRWKALIVIALAQLMVGALPGVRHLAQAVYGLVARNRHRIPGPWEHTCRI
ncbi:DUF393 domain-containing protein [Streptomyces barringtoniae]|uniref:DUF393 domain-containing protein n=1 Tax=Streptomyces barringtoniae TaxID=2892029 RepID=UPI001E4AFE89|nr:DUF393 domain-containing protein [Streptomyces barringtoniae]MCC5477351.1 DUF393 domain-containing protein [Streptomyces barringtoniae]